MRIFHKIAGFVVSILCLAAVNVGAEPSSQAEKKSDLVKRDISVSCSIESAEDDPIGIDGELVVKEKLPNGFSAVFGVGIKGGDSLDLSSCLISWSSGLLYANAGYAKQKLGPGLFRPSAKRLGLSRGITDELAEYYAFSRKGPIVSLGCEYKKNELPLSANFAMRYLGEALPPAFSLSTALHLGKRDRLVGLTGALLPLEADDPVRGKRIDLHALASLYAADFESVLVWSIEGAVGTVPDATPWTFPDYSPSPLAFWGGAELTTGYRIASASSSMFPGFRFSVKLDDLGSPLEFRLKTLVGIKAILFDGFSVWAWAGIQEKSTSAAFAAAWDAGMELEL